MFVCLVRTKHNWPTVGTWRTGQWARARRRLFSSTATLATNTYIHNRKSRMNNSRCSPVPDSRTAIGIANGIASVVFPIQVGVATPTALAASRAASPTAR